MGRIASQLEYWLKIHENPEVLQSLVRGRQLSTSARRTCHLPVSWALGEFSVANTGPAVDSLSKHLWMVLLMGKFVLSSYSLFTIYAARNEVKDS